MQKKGLALNMTILLVLSLIVIIILGFLIAGSSGAYRKGTSCEAAGGKCLKAVECEGGRSFLAGCKQDQICCIKEGE